MRVSVFAAILACISPYSPSVATVIECRDSLEDKHIMIDGLNVTEVKWPDHDMGWITFKLDNYRGVELIASSGDFEEDLKILSSLQFIFDGKQFVGHGKFELDGQKFEMRSILTADRFLYFVSNHRGQTNKVLTGEVSCLNVSP